jgi:F0F1-type ATP synthase assembly protein I
VISQRMGRFLSAVGALLLIGGLFLTWYHIDRAGGFVENATGFDTFTRLRLVILAGAVVLLLTAIVAQTQPVLIVRTLIGVVLGILILRRIVFPPDIADPVKSQFGVFVGLVGAVCAVLGGIVDTTREVAERYPEMAFWRPPAGELGAGAPPQEAGLRRRPQDPQSGGAVVDSTAEEIR